MLSAPACAADKSAAEEVEPERVETPLFTAEDGSYRLELPLGWRREGQALTLEGWDFQVITFNAGPLSADGDGDENDDDGSEIDPTAPELLQAMQEELAADPGVKVIACQAATFDGLAGFRLHLEREEPARGGSTDDSMAITRALVICGAIDGGTLYAFSLEALAPHPFERDLAAFERLVASFERVRTGP